MTSKELGRGQTVNAPTESVLIIEQYLNDNYLFRRNELNGKVEFAVIRTDAEGHPVEEEPLFRPLTQEALNTSEMLNIIRDEYPHVAVTQKAKVELGRVLASLNYERKDHGHVAYYRAIPLVAA